MKLLLPLSICLLGLFAFAIPNLSSEGDSYSQEKVLTVMRKIGHELLLAAGNKHSKVLPIEQLGDNAYTIKFETSFQFETPQLVDIVQKNVSAANLPKRYIVSVLGCQKESVFYSYEYTPKTQIDSLHCLTRKNDLGCYNIKISFAYGARSGFLSKQSFAFSVPLVLLAIISFICLRKKETISNTDAPANSNTMKFGNTSFDTRSRILIYRSCQTELTEKETRIMSIFASHQNEVVERDQLLKEVWEDEGVFVGRSLDVFVSRLRKKLEADPTVNIINVHGRGYKLETI